MPISPMKEAMLRALAHYKYLTVSHVLALDISKSKAKAGQYFRELKKDYGFVGRQKHIATYNDPKNPDHIRRTRQEYLRHLTAKGTRFLQQQTELSEIHFPKRPKEYLSNDYAHRVSTISMHISFDKWMQQIGANKAQFLTYYKQRKDATSKRFESETRISLDHNKHYTPDAICSFTHEGKAQIYVLEVYNSKGNNRTQYVEQQLEKLFWIIDNTKKIEQRLGVDVVPRILCTLDTPNFRDAVIKRIKANPYFHVEGIEELLFFGLDSEIWDGFGKGWSNLFDNILTLGTDALLPVPRARDSV